MFNAFRKKFDRATPEVQDRIPPGQYLTEKFPVLHYGDVPAYPDLEQTNGIGRFVCWIHVDKPTMQQFDSVFWIDDPNAIPEHVRVATARRAVHSTLSPTLSTLAKFARPPVGATQNVSPNRTSTADSQRRLDRDPSVQLRVGAPSHASQEP